MRFSTRDNISCGILILLVIFAPWGSVFDFNFVSFSLGVSTVLALFLIGCRFFNSSFYKIFWAEPLYYLGGLFVVGASLGSFFGYYPYAGFVKALMYLLFMMLGIAVSSLNYNEKYLSILLACMCGSVATVVGISVMDYVGYISFDGFNQITRTINLGYDEDLVDELGSMSGPFRSRTELMSYVILVTPLTMWFSFASKYGKIIRLYYCFLSCVLILGTFMAGSRGAYVALLVVLVMYLLILFSKGRIKELSWVGIIGAFLGTFIFFKFPDIWLRIGLQLKTMLPENIVYRESDMGRFELWYFAMKEVALRPMGVGFSQVEMSPGLYVHVHNYFLDLVHAAGVFSLPFLFVFVRRVFLNFEFFKADVMQVPLYGVLVSFSFFNLTHSQWGTNLFWILLGLFVIICHPKRLLFSR